MGKLHSKHGESFSISTPVASNSGDGSAVPSDLPFVSNRGEILCEKSPANMTAVLDDQTTTDRNILNVETENLLNLYTGLHTVETSRDKSQLLSTKMVEPFESDVIQSSRPIWIYQKEIDNHVTVCCHQKDLMRTVQNVKKFIQTMPPGQCVNDSIQTPPSLDEDRQSKFVVLHILVDASKTGELNVISSSSLSHDVLGAKSLHIASSCALEDTQKLPSSTCNVDQPLRQDNTIKTDKPSIPYECKILNHPVKQNYTGHINKSTTYPDTRTKSKQCELVCAKDSDDKRAVCPLSKDTLKNKRRAPGYFTCCYRRQRASKSSRDSNLNVKEHLPERNTVCESQSVKRGIKQTNKETSKEGLLSCDPSRKNVVAKDEDIVEEEEESLGIFDEKQLALLIQQSMEMNQQNIPPKHRRWHRESSRNSASSSRTTDNNLDVTMSPDSVIKLSNDCGIFSRHDVSAERQESKVICHTDWITEKEREQKSPYSGRSLTLLDSKQSCGENTNSFHVSQGNVRTCVQNRLSGVPEYLTWNTPVESNKAFSQSMQQTPRAPLCDDLPSSNRNSQTQNNLDLLKTPVCSNSLATSKSPNNISVNLPDFCFHFASQDDLKPSQRYERRINSQIDNKAKLQSHLREPVSASHYHRRHRNRDRNRMRAMRQVADWIEQSRKEQRFKSGSGLVVLDEENYAQHRAEQNLSVLNEELLPWCKDVIQHQHVHQHFHHHYHYY